MRLSLEVTRTGRSLLTGAKRKKAQRSRPGRANGRRVSVILAAHRARWVTPLLAEGRPAAPSQPKIVAGMGYGAGFARDQAPEQRRGLTRCRRRSSIALGGRRHPGNGGANAKKTFAGFIEQDRSSSANRAGRIALNYKGCQPMLSRKSHTAAELPLTSFSGILKQIRFSGLTFAGRSLMDFAFPGFLGPTYSGNIDTTESTVNRRRFAPAQDFPRGRYYSVVADADMADPERIDDGGAMVGELRAYCDPLATGEIGILDTSSDTFYTRSIRIVKDKQRHIVTMASFPGDVIINMYDSIRVEKLFGDLETLAKDACDEYKTLRVYHDGSSLSISLQYSAQEKSFGRVLDLRIYNTSVKVCDLL